MYSLKLFFVGSKDPALFQTDFACGQSKASAVRGKTSGAFAGRGSFHWSSAVRAVCVLAIKTSMASRGFGQEPVLYGEQGSLAASLDYAVSKETEWLLDVFGVSEGQIPNCRRLFKRTNSGRKRSGPVAVSFCKALHEVAAIEIKLNGDPLSTQLALEDLLNNLSQHADNLVIGSAS
jgi:hypothetical protein